MTRLLWFCLLAVVALDPGSAAETITYSYDALGRLVATVHTGSVNNGLQSAYSHDLADNRTSVTVSGASSGKVIVVPLNGFTIIPLPAGY